MQVKTLGDDTQRLASLGNDTKYVFDSPHVDILETFPNLTPERRFVVNYRTDEFTSLCPKTNQPDFGHIDIGYVPDQLCVETKSLKLYLFAFRNTGSFMETIVNKICTDFVQACKPHDCQVRGIFKARGGVEVDVLASYTRPTPVAEQELVTQVPVSRRGINPSGPCKRKQVELGLVVSDNRDCERCGTGPCTNGEYRRLES